MKFKITATLVALSMVTSVLSVDTFRQNTSTKESETNATSFLSQLLQPVVATATETSASSAKHTLKQLTLKNEAGTNVNSFTSDDGVYSLAVYSYTVTEDKEVVKQEYYLGISSIVKGASPALNVVLSDIGFTVPNEVLTLMSEAGYDTTNLDSIKAIDASVFSGTSIKTIDLSGVEYIGNSVLSSCPYITEITLPKSIEYLGDSIFASSGLKTLNVDCSLSAIPAKLCSKTKLSKITLAEESNLLEIGANAFEGTPLTAFPFQNANSLVLIGEYAFKDCTQIKSFTVPDSTIRIDGYAFAGCTALESLTMGKSLMTIDKAAFSGCTALTDITFGGNLHSLGGGVFQGCTSLISVSGMPETIGDWVEVEENTGYGFGNNMFAGCTKLRSVELPASLTTVPESMFMGCSSLTGVVFKGNIVAIADMAFSDCTNLQEVSFTDDTMGTVGEKAFMNCTSLLKTPFTKCTVLGASAFAGCTSLTSVTLDAESYGKNAFSDCTSLKSAVLNDASLGETFPVGLFKNCTALSQLKNTDKGTTFSSSIIGAEAFSNCTSLKSVGFNNAVILEDSCFSGCTALQSVCSGDLTAEDYASNCFKNCTSLSQSINCYASTIGANAFMGSGVKKVNIKGTVGTTAVYGNNAFAQCSNLETVNIVVGDGIEYSIGTGLFTGCPALKEVSFSGTEITNGMFKDCSALSKISIPNAVDIRDNAFSGCSALSNIESPIFKTVGSSAFLNCSSVVTLPIDITTTFSGKSQFSGCARLIEMQAKTLSDSMFLDCASLKTVQLGSDISVIPANCFMNCASLSGIDLKGITSFEAGCLANTGLTGNLTLTGATTIGNKAFAGCTKLTGLTISANTIGASAFESCTSVGSVDVSAKEIQRSAFYKCDNLKTLTVRDLSASIPLSNIGSSAFADCSLLTEAIILADEAELSSKALGYVSGKAMSDFWVVGNTGSTAESYASDNGFTFVPLSKYDADSRNLSKKLLGDVDCNGTVSIADAVRMQSWLVGRQVGVYGDNMDMNSDDIVNVFDLCLLKKQLLEE